MSTAKELDQRSPPYIPWKSFENYISGLKGTVVPHTLDNTVRPRSMSGGLWRQILSALRFLELTSEGNISTPALEAVVGASGTDQWPAAIKEHVIAAYDAIVGDLPIDRATPGQLQSRFRENSGADGQVMKKCVRFYIHALKNGGIKYSSHFAMRDEGGGSGTTPRSNTPRKRKKSPGAPTRETQAEKPKQNDVTDSTPSGAIDFPIPIGTTPKAYFIRVPINITKSDIPLVEAMVAGVKALAEQNEGKEKK